LNFGITGSNKNITGRYHHSNKMNTGSVPGMMEPGKMESGEKPRKMEPAEMLSAEEGAHVGSGWWQR
jgi:hypothetical protein